MKFSSRELRDLSSAGVILSLAFAILLTGNLTGLLTFKAAFLSAFTIAFFTAGAGFLLHELMHKWVAQSYGLHAAFRAFYGMLWIALGLSFFGFIFAAPGAVFISGMITREKNGKISLAGPATNIVLALLFLFGMMVLSLEGILLALFRYGLSINALLAAFNMIPSMPFDGAKILAWNKVVYFVTLIIALCLFGAQFFI